MSVFPQRTFKFHLRIIHQGIQILACASWNRGLCISKAKPNDFNFHSPHNSHKKLAKNTRNCTHKRPGTTKNGFQK